MKLCITEKPSVGRDIASILGANTRRDGYFEGNGYCVTWTFGHLCCLKEPHDYTPNWKRWSLGALPMIPSRFSIKVIPQESIERQFKVIETLIGQCDEVINCGDAGQEGELIQRWVMQRAGCKKPVSRLWISSLTDESIREGFQHLKPQAELEKLYTAGLCRAIGDWILGMNATRLYTLKYSEPGQVLSIGRVQTPTLALVVNRQREIENFVPVDTWELRTKYRDTVFTATLKPFETQEKGQQILDKIKDFPFEIDSVTKKPGKEASPRLFDLTSLQVECNKKFGMSADLTLRTIQSLYEKKLTTYPRVDTTYLTDDVYPKCGPILNSLTDYQDLLQQIRGSKLRKSKKVFDNSKVTDHHAIIPTGVPVPPNLTDFEKNVFHTIARRFVSVFFPDCTFEQTTVEGHVEKVKFKVGGKVIKSPGWRVVYSADAASDAGKDSEVSVLPVFTKGESGPHEPMLAKKTSQPPKYFTEGTLLKAMETAGSLVDDEELREALKANGIGRPSTRAAIIETLFKRGYIRRERKSLRATQAGTDLIDLIKEDLLKSAKLTGLWENRLRRIEQGTYDASEFIAAQKQMISQIVYSVLSDNNPRRIVVETSNDKKSTGKSK
ncbi:MAG: DNA topoisomerase 3 [Prevotella sp.]|nr:DNA topoisomerase 3 [Prevotella sp.]MCM1074669.1 DNA topoisomerase 3 [Ruminococcus sp.]